MATSPLFGWQEPDDTSLVKDGAAAIRTLGNAIDSSMGDLLGGTTGQVLAKASNTNMDFTWVAQDDSNAIQNAIVDAKGDLISATANDTPARLAVGNNGETLVADSSTSTGLKWAKSANFVGCRATKTGTNQTLSNNTYTLVTFNAETYDTDGFHSTSTNTERMTIPAGLAGYYEVTANVGFDTNTTGRRLLQIRKNGSAIAVGEASSATSTNYPAFNTSLIVNLAVGDYVDFEAYQTSGGNLDVLVQPERTFLQIERVGS